ncbi:YtxH domain-containing protein [Candidatus Cardinium hertigii]|jgi:gas vesicle protein|uniref:YtxH domain-containing protein n=1 Tax=Candidatus Cardinium hertigii TaxID=247481 RepID=A0A3N2QBJ3_9BACT|nr:YtxH domain-containing protein [Candidatus Cardinium hertigii]ROT47188.1 YtxH domain-containing protein [Candidatus Cardinium hertigii]
MKKRTENLIILLIGLCLGALIGMLSTPTTGSVVRSGLIYSLKSYRKKLQAFILKLMGNKNDIINQAKNTGKEVISDVVSSAEKILKELDTLTEQLGQKVH